MFVAADGPRDNIAGEKEKCAKVRTIIEKIDWDCDIKTLFRKKNLGCKKAVSSAIDWFFEHEEYGIILEDDCVPNESFFGFCEIMLNKYKDDERVGMVSGNNFLFNKNNLNNHSYYFSRYTHIWGWATWRRSWKKYDVSMSAWPEYKKSGMLKNKFNNRISEYYWSDIFSKVYAGNIDTWDYQWMFINFLNNSLT